MTTLTMRVVRGDFIVTGPDIEPMKFKSRREAQDWRKVYHPASAITEIGPGGKRAVPRNRQSGRRGAARNNAPAARVTAGHLKPTDRSAEEARSARRDRIRARKSAAGEVRRGRGGRPCQPSPRPAFMARDAF